MPPDTYPPTNSGTPQPADPGHGSILGDEVSRNAAADLIRQKVAAIYASEPNAKIEAAEAAAVPSRSAHQEYMYRLSTSGRSPEEIQTAWHNYYTALPDEEKHHVWQEFYSASQSAGTAPQAQQPFQPPAVQAVEPQPPAQRASLWPEQLRVWPPPEPQAQPQPETQPQPEAPSAPLMANPNPSHTYEPLSLQDAVPAQRGYPARLKQLPSIADIKKKIRKTISAGGKLKAKHHFQSLVFGLASGVIVLFIFLFGFFNEVFLAPFIQPSRVATETPIIVDTASAVVGTTPKVIIPKINVEIPVDYSQTSTANSVIESALDNGIVHYPSTVRPGQVGNAAFFGHSSNNIFNPGKYKFAFVLLHELVEGDTFYLTNEGKAYAYRVISRTVVEPTQVSVLEPYPGKAATATLITCDPPGTSLKRLVVVGEQISPDPGGNAAPAATPPIQTATETGLPGNGSTLWSRIWSSIF